MSYKKHNFISKQKLTAQSLNEIEDGIITNEESISQLSQEIVDQKNALDGMTLGVHTDGLIYVFVNGEPTGTGVEFITAGGDVVGYVDSENNIVLTGKLEDGEYSIKYEMEDGSEVNIGTLELSSVAYVNLADPTSSDWLNNNRFSTSTGAGKSCEQHILTNFIKAKIGSKLYVKGLHINQYVNGYPHIVAIYDSSKAYKNFVYTGMGGSSSADAAQNQVTVNGDVSTYTILVDDTGKQRADATTTYIRIDGTLMDGYTVEDVIITIDEEIV